MARKLEVEIVGDASSLNRALGSAGKSGQTFGQKIQHGAKIAGLALGGVLAAGAVVGFKEMEQMAKVSAQTSAVLKSTGGQANVTAGQVDELLTSLMRKSGVDDEVIASSENVLLTFQNVHNEVGKGNDIFNQATASILDMSVALGKDLQSTTIQVGKALNDPVKNLGKLQKAGVDFSAKQVTLIKRLAETGDLAGAQKIILQELQEEYGGSAKALGETLPGKINIAKESFKNMAGELMLSLMPALTVIAEQLTKFAGFLEKHPALAKAMVIGVAALAVALGLLSISATIAAASLTALWIASGIGIAVALAAALTILYMKSEKFRAAVDFLRDHWKVLLFAFGLLPGIAVQIVRHWDSIKSVGVAAFDAVKGAIQRVIDISKTVIDWIGKVIKKIGDVTSGPIDAVADAFDTIVGNISTVIQWIKSLISWIGKIPHIPGTGGSSPGSPNPAPGSVGGPGGQTQRAIQGAGGSSVSVNFNGPVYGDPKSIAQAVREEFVKMQRNGSKLGFT